MKRCPECRRDYFDDSLLYCLDDGSALLDGPASGEARQGNTDEPATAILHSAADSDEAKNAAQIQWTERTQILPRSQTQTRSSKKLITGGLLVLATLLAAGLGYRFFAGGDRINSIAVLPLQNNSGNADSEYLSDGLAESLIYRLSQLPDLKVSPASSVMRYKGKEFDAQKIATELGVQAVMSGRMVQRGDNLSISIELIDAINNKTIW